LNFDPVGATHLSAMFAETREHNTLDTRIIYTISVKLPGQLEIPIVGGGGKFQVAQGDSGRLIGFHGIWRPADPDVIHARVIPKEKVEAVFLHPTKGMQLVKYNSSLAYYSAPAFRGQEFLYPVPVDTAPIAVDDRFVPMYLVTQPATEFGPSLDQIKSQKSVPVTRSRLSASHTPKPSHEAKCPHIVPRKSSHKTKCHKALNCLASLSDLVVASKMLEDL